MAQITDETVETACEAYWGENWVMLAKTSKGPKIRAAMRCALQAASPPQAVKVDDEKALTVFTEYFVKNYPGPRTIIGKPDWHAPKIYRAAKHAILSAIQQEESK